MKGEFAREAEGFIEALEEEGLKWTLENMRLDL